MSPYSETTPTAPENQRLQEANADLSSRLEEAEETLRAIRSGEVDALVVQGLGGAQIFTLQGTESESNQFRGGILSQISDAVVAMDNDRHVTYLNLAAEQQYGVGVSDALGMPASDLWVDQWNNPADQEAAQRAMNDGCCWRGESRHLKRDGETIHVESAVAPLHDATGAHIGALATIRDITDRKRTEQLLHEQRQLLEAIAKGVPLTDCLAGLCTAVTRLSPRARICVLLTDAAHKSFSQIIAPTLSPSFAAALTNAPIEETALGSCAEAVFTGLHVTCADIAEQNRWSPIWRDLCLENNIRACRSAPVFNPHGKAFASIMLCLDEARAPNQWEQRLIEFGISVVSIAMERERSAQSLLEAKEAAEQANQSKDRFLAVLSHELRTPLTPALLAAAALEQDGRLPEPLREDLAMIKRNIELETKLIDDLLDISRITTGKLTLKSELVNLNEVVRDVCDICRSQLHEQGQSLDVSLDPRAGVISADPARFRQVLWNVLNNAIKFTPLNGRIGMSTARLSDDTCEIRIQDSGAGIPPEVLPHIFNAFEQGGNGVTRQFGGLGLGLAISKALIDFHGGSIRAESAGAGQGATFVIEIPGKLLTATARIRLTAPPITTPLPSLRLLLVEDNLDTARVLTKLLTRAGFTVLSASDVATATAISDAESFDVLVSDLGLPDGTGHEVMRRVRHTHHVPGIAMSGYGMDEDLRRSRDAGFVEHLVKPVQASQIIDAIRRVIR
ncbi:MAG: ATP-binding protein [Verrucomicrobiota bacterium]